MLKMLSCYKDINKRLLNEKYNLRDISAYRGTFGVTVRDSGIYISPTFKAVLSPEKFNLNCEGLCKTATPLFIEETYANFAKVIGTNIKGYVSVNDIAIISKSTAKLLLTHQRKLKVTGAFAVTNPSACHQLSKVVLSYGTSLPFYPCYNKPYFEVLLPFRNKNGVAVWKKAEILKSQNVHIGNLKFTRKIFLNTALSVLGTPYDWGGSFGSYDCSSLISTTFSLFGIIFPRNSYDIGKLKGIFIKNPEKDFDKCVAGDILYMKGHVMIYAGKYGNNHYIYHSFYGNKRADITSINVLTSKGKPLKEVIEKIIPLNFL
ncbi:MAG: C40 family peptidase [Clostridia bacterium]|nr:C40 family peptidase [Clostridia bacterium]